MCENERECARMSENRARIFCQTRVVRECENATRIECMPRGGGGGGGVLLEKATY